MNIKISRKLIPALLCVLSPSREEYLEYIIPKSSSNRGGNSLAATDNQVNTTALTESFGKKIGYLKAPPAPKLQEEGYELLKNKSPLGVKPEDLTTPLNGSVVFNPLSQNSQRPDTKVGNGKPGPAANAAPTKEAGTNSDLVSKKGDASKTGTEASATTDSHNSYSLSDLLYRESRVLGGVKEIVQGAKARAEEAIHDWPLTAVELASGVAIGSALVLASRNPALAASMRILNQTMLGFAAVDLTSRVAIPSYDALVHPQNLEADRHDLGNRLGAAAVDYSMAAIAGGIGSRSVTPLIERTPLGSLVSGYDFFKMPGGAEVRVFKSGNALITKRGLKVFRTNSIDFDDLDPTAAAKKGIVGNNDLLRRTFEDAEQHPEKWREGKDITESAGKFGTWFEAMTGALATEVAERSVDVGIGLLEHDYLKKTLETSGSTDEAIVPVPVDKAKQK